MRCKFGLIWSLCVDANLNTSFNLYGINDLNWRHLQKPQFCPLKTQNPQNFSSCGCHLKFAELACEPASTDLGPLGVKTKFADLIGPSLRNSCLECPFLFHSTESYGCSREPEEFEMHVEMSYPPNSEVLQRERSACSHNSSTTVLSSIL